MYSFKVLTKYVKNKNKILFKNLIFYGHYGEEFKFKKVLEYLNSKTSKIIQIVTPNNVSELGIIERGIRTLQETLAISIDYIKNNKTV